MTRRLQIYPYKLPSPKYYMERQIPEALMYQTGRYREFVKNEEEMKNHKTILFSTVNFKPLLHMKRSLIECLPCHQQLLIS